MYIYRLQYSHKGFSTLMALGTVGVLLIIVSGLAVTYIREMHLSRANYDEIVAYAGAEGMFEYAMLKVRNHREGFSDTVTSSDIDGSVVTPTTPRSRGLQGSHEITSNSLDATFPLSPDDHLIVPLFSAPGIVLSGLSKNPDFDTNIEKVQNLQVELSDLSWTIVAMDGTMSVGLTGSGDISPTKTGIVRHKNSKCYRGDNGSEIDCSLLDVARGDEELQYFSDISVSVADFINKNTDPYIMIYNNTQTTRDVRITGATPFSLPTLTVRSQAQKNDSVQVFQFSEDKSRYYDALKYGVYNAD